ncbi:uncharacterized protein LOC100488012 isoform X2 [Xenopus tropicalis]|uniref:Uncharacterized protein LOC100488012 isoform X2 n=1 Tax=Xenopus tropicalis TaxID=8364 RepID=A0A8J1IQ81_XENTR|nr:uncharacterized protein LOC100488012 isoform X2 [Xenopus tropicalis]
MRLLIPLLSVLLMSLRLLGTAVYPSGQINKPLNDTATFHHGFELGAKTFCTIWMTSQGEPREVAEYRNDHFQVTNEQFQASTVFMKSTLKIQNLTMNDSGIYDISCWYAPNPAKRRRVFKLTVYEPVQQPVIKTKCQCGYIDCNCTLHCQDPTNSSSAHWVILHNSKPVNNSAHKRTIWTLLGDTCGNIKYMCVLQNPADQKNASVGFWQLCSTSRYSEFLCMCWAYQKAVIIGIMTVIVAVVSILARFIFKKIKEAVLRKLRGYFPSWRTEVDNQNKEGRLGDMEMTSVKSKLKDNTVLRKLRGYFPSWRTEVDNQNKECRMGDMEMASVKSQLLDNTG